MPYCVRLGLGKTPKCIGLVAGFTINTFNLLLARCFNSDWFHCIKVKTDLKHLLNIFTFILVLVLFRIFDLRYINDIHRTSKAYTITELHTVTILLCPFFFAKNPKFVRPLKLYNHIPIKAVLRNYYITLAFLKLNRITMSQVC